MNLKTKIISAALFATVAIAIASPLAEAAIPKPSTLPGLTMEQQAEKGGKAAKEHVGAVMIPQVVNILIGAVSIACLAFLIFGGIRYMLAYGEEEALGETKKIIIYSLLGLLISMFSYAIVAIIASIKLEDPRPTSFIPVAFAKYEETKDMKLQDSMFGNPDASENVKNLPFAKIPEEETSVMDYIVQSLYKNVIKLALGVASILIIVSFAAAGMLYVTAQGNEDMTNKAKSILIYTVIAVAIIGSAYAITLGFTKLKDYFYQ